MNKLQPADLRDFAILSISICCRGFISRIYITAEREWRLCLAACASGGTEKQPSGEDGEDDARRENNREGGVAVRSRREHHRHCDRSDRDLWPRFSLGIFTPASECNLEQIGGRVWVLRKFWTWGGRVASLETELFFCCILRASMP